MLSELESELLDTLEEIINLVDVANSVAPRDLLSALPLSTVLDTYNRARATIAIARLKGLEA